MLVLAVKHRLALNCSPPASAFQVLRLQLFTPHLASRKFLHTRASLEVALKCAGLGDRSGDGGRWRVGGGGGWGEVRRWGLFFLLLQLQSPEATFPLLCRQK